MTLTILESRSFRRRELESAGLLHVERTDIKFSNKRPDLIDIRILVTNAGVEYSTPTHAVVSAALLALSDSPASGVRGLLESSWIGVPLTPPAGGVPAPLSGPPCKGDPLAVWRKRWIVAGDRLTGQALRLVRAIEVH